MDADAPLRPIRWMGSSLSDLQACPDDVKDQIGYALHVAQEGGKHASAKPLRGFGGASVLEIVANDAGNTYRGVYTVQLASAIYVLHVFMKKSKRGIQTPQSDLDLIGKRLRSAIEHEENKKRQPPR